MAKNTQITDLIDEWKPRKALADQIDANVEVIHKWAKWNRIPSEWQAIVVRAAQKKGLKHVTAEWMLAAHMRDASAARLSAKVSSPAEASP